MIYKISSRMERVFARLQRKGWGVSTMSQDVNRLAKFVSDPLLGIDIGANSGEYTARLKNKPLIFSKSMWRVTNLMYYAAWAIPYLKLN